MENEVLKAIKVRRSVRKYQDMQIKPEELQTVLEAGTYAPSGRGAQCPVMVAVQNPQTVQQIVKMNAAVMGTDSNPYYEAPSLILVFVPKAQNTAIEDGSCVLNTMMLAAHSIGLASCWIHRERQMFETDEGRSLMKDWGIPDDHIGVGGLALGYAEEELPNAAPRRDGRIILV